MEKTSSFFILGRFILGLFFVIVGIINIVQWQMNLTVVKTHAIPYPTYALAAAIAGEILLGLLLALGKLQRFAALLLIIFTLSVASVYLDFWTMTGPARISTLIQFLSDIAIIGGLLLIVGKPK